MNKQFANGADPTTPHEIAAAMTQTIEITITPDLPYFAATADCDWRAARRLAAELGPEHVAAVAAAERMADDEASADDETECGIRRKPERWPDVQLRRHH